MSDLIFWRGIGSILQTELEMRCPHGGLLDHFQLTIHYLSWLKAFTYDHKATLSSCNYAKSWGSLGTTTSASLSDVLTGLKAHLVGCFPLHSWEGGLGVLALVYYNSVEVPHPLPVRTMSLTLASPHEGWCWPWETERGSIDGVALSLDMEFQVSHW